MIAIRLSNRYRRYQLPVKHDRDVVRGNVQAHEAGNQIGIGVGHISDKGVRQGLIQKLHRDV